MAHWQRVREAIPETVIRAGVAAGKSDGEIAREIGSYPVAVQRRRTALGIAAVRRGRVPRAVSDGELAAWHGEGLTDTEMADRAGVSSGTIRCYRSKLGLPPNVRATRRITDDEVRECRAKSLTDRAAAARLGCAEGTYRRRREALGLTRVVAEGPRAPCIASPDVLRRAVRLAFALDPSDPRILPMLEPYLAAEMASA
ncbi:hypothetical protein [Salipiger abyssi]|uniref:hypothetical protein n=1 Tax=Salipiger abyssi TaxID=1250539 RepID=UPI004058A859